jgi:UDP-N-acetylmuramyl pentapeptide phosphotransferase/UDP-N-acetylglucosamine-1-phosphate transferase
LALSVLIASFAAASVLCALLVPVFRHVFLVIPGARSSHAKATPQGGGLVVIPVALIVAGAAWFGYAGARPDAFAWSLIAAVLLLTLLGGWDDLGSLNFGFRLLVQAGAAGLALAAAPLDFSGPMVLLPPVLVYGCLLIGMIWFINLTNFMDGIDLMSVTQFVPAFATVYLLLWGSAGPAQWLALLCLANVGALSGFALLNRPSARLFLGDSGSLPLGIIGAVAILVVAAARGPVAAILPFVYYIADASLTLARRILAGQKFWQAHREHFYQRATRRGLSTWQVIARVAPCNILLCALALLVAGAAPAEQLAALAFGGAAVAWLMRDLVRERA